jgi:hypothetical protein
MKWAYYPGGRPELTTCFYSGRGRARVAIFLPHQQSIGRRRWLALSMPRQPMASLAKGRSQRATRRGNADEVMSDQCRVPLPLEPLGLWASQGDKAQLKPWPGILMSVAPLTAASVYKRLRSSSPRLQIVFPPCREGRQSHGTPVERQSKNCPTDQPLSVDCNDESQERHSEPVAPTARPLPSSDRTRSDTENSREVTLCETKLIS